VTTKIQPKYPPPLQLRDLTWPLQWKIEKKAAESGEKSLSKFCVAIIDQHLTLGDPLIAPELLERLRHEAYLRMQDPRELLDELLRKALAEAEQEGV
jgi:hypothetical protein